MTNERSEPTVGELFDLSGKCALITGGSGHLGGAMARALAEAGANVVVSSRELARAEDVASALPRRNGQNHGAVQLDHMDEKSIDIGFDQALTICGKLEILVNNGQQTLSKDWTSISANEFTQQLANATGYFLLCRRMHDHAISCSADASIVLLGSMYGLVGSYPSTYEGICPSSPVAYHMLKGGVVNLARHLAVYWAKDRVRVNCLSPGPFPPPRVSVELTKRLCEHSPVNRMGAAHELKGAIVFLTSAASSYMTGQNLVIDGGWTAW